MTLETLCRIGEKGFVHNIATGKDLSSGYSSAAIFYKDPDGAVDEVACDVVTEADGDFGATAAAAYFDIEGIWEAQLEVTGATWIFKLKTPLAFRVGASGE